MKYTRPLWIFCLAAVLLTGGAIACKKKRGASGDDGSLSSEGQIVCIIDGIALREEPVKSGKWMTSISLGEIVKDLGKTQTDPADKDRSYTKVQLSDGRTGWAATTGLVVNARLGAIKEDATIYKRPDPLTATNTKIEFMTPVAITQEKSDWVEFISTNRKKKGWIKKDAVTSDPADTSVAVLALKKLRAKDPQSLRKFLESAPNQDSYFIRKLQERADAPPAPETEPAKPTFSSSATDAPPEPSAD